MVAGCCAYGCFNERIPGGTLTFHRFPMRNPELLKLWTNALGRENFQPNKHTVLCGDHFKPCDYLESSKNHNLLKKDAVPSIFKIQRQPRYLSKEKKIPTASLLAQIRNDELIESDPLSTPDTFIQENSEVEVDIMENKENNGLIECDPLAIATLDSTTQENCELSGLGVSQGNYNFELMECGNIPTSSTTANGVTHRCPELDVVAQKQKKTDVGTQTSPSLERSSPSQIKLRRHIKVLQQKLRRKDVKIRNLQVLIACLKECDVLADGVMCKKQLPKLQDKISSSEEDQSSCLTEEEDSSITVALESDFL